MSQVKQEAGKLLNSDLILFFVLLVTVSFDKSIHVEYFILRKHEGFLLAMLVCKSKVYF